MTRHDSRILALLALFCWDAQRGQLDDVFRDVLNDFWSDFGKTPSGAHVEYARRLFGETVSNLSQIDSLISKVSVGWPLSRMPRVDLCVIRLALAEMLYVKETPLEVVIDESLELLKEFSTHASPKFVNGVLMGIFRELGYVPALPK